MSQTKVQLVEQTVTQVLAPPGAIAYVCQNTAPTGWLKANGAKISRSTYLG